MNVKTIYESGNFLVIDKPYDMYINSNDKDEKNTVAFHVAQHDSHLSSSSNPLHFVQRLDYATSGVLCIAKNKLYAGKAGKVLEKRKARKYYLAVVRGQVTFGAVNIQYEVGEDTRTDSTNHKMLAITSTELASVARFVRKADTKLLVLERGYYDDEPCTIVMLKPNTGRRHQLRVHCAALGHTILGDFTYSDGSDQAPHRMFLHATRLVLPIEEEYLDLQSDYSFFKDEKFSTKWRNEITLHQYSSKESFMLLCELLDELDVDVVKILNKS